MVIVIPNSEGHTEPRKARVAISSAELYARFTDANNISSCYRKYAAHEVQVSAEAIFR